MTKAFKDGRFVHVAPDALSAEDAPAIDLDAMTKAELLAEAQRRGIDVPESSTKAEIIENLNTAV